jgi:hypothetical protein
MFIYRSTTFMTNKKCKQMKYTQNWCVMCEVPTARVVTVCSYGARFRISNRFVTSESAESFSPPGDVEGNEIGLIRHL